MDFMGGERGKEGSCFFISNKSQANEHLKKTPCWLGPKAGLALAQSPQSLCVALRAPATSGLHHIQPVVLKLLARLGTNG